MTFAFLMHCTLSFSQNYPYYQVDSTGQVLVVMTLQQAQNLDNKTDQISHFAKIDQQILKYDSVCTETIFKQDSLINELGIEIDSLTELSNLKDMRLEGLSSIIDVKNNIILNLDSQIAVYANENKSLKRKYRITKITSAIGIIGLVIAFL